MGSPGSESSKQNDEGRLRASHSVRRGCLFQWQQAERGAAQPGQVVSAAPADPHCSRWGDLPGNRWIPAVRPPCLVKTSMTLLGDTEDLQRQRVCECLHGRRQSREGLVTLPSVLLTTASLTAEKCSGGISRLQGDNGNHLVGTFCWLVLLLFC